MIVIGDSVCWARAWHRLGRVRVAYASAADPWAAWIAWQLGDLGLRVFLRSWEVHAGAHWLAEIDDGSATRT